MSKVLFYGLLTTTSIGFAHCIKKHHVREKYFNTPLIIKKEWENFMKPNGLLSDFLIVTNEVVKIDSSLSREIISTVNNVKIETAGIRNKGDILLDIQRPVRDYLSNNSYNSFIGKNAENFRTQLHRVIDDAVLPNNVQKQCNDISNVFKNMSKIDAIYWEFLVEEYRNIEYRRCLFKFLKEY
jgi:hypothetical protein